MLDAKELFRPLIGKHAWQVRRGYGTFLTMEFGEPHLEIREPRAVDSDASKSVRRGFERRRISVVGDWHLWVQYCMWTVRTKNLEASSEESDLSKIDTCLEELDGQALLVVEEDFAASVCTLHFDLGAIVTLSPSPEFLEDDLWMLYCPDRNTFAYRASEGVVAEGE